MDFSEFYQAQWGPLVKLCYLATLDAEAAADAAQEAMLRGLTRWDALQGEEPTAWVKVVALNLCRSRWRRLQRDLRFLPRLVTSPVESPSSDPSLVDALARLPRRQREAIVLRYWEDMTVEQCANVMGVSVGSVNQHLGRARETLKRSPAVNQKEGLAWTG
jgi:RNA polymerase sigma-70 factor (ECF subfamily)